MIARSCARIVIPIILFAIPILRATGATEFGERLTQALRSAGPSDELVIWISFVDKGEAGLRKPDPRALVSPRSLERRLKVLPPDKAVDFTDIPVERTYVEQVRNRGVRIRQQSRWFNAVSATATAEQIKKLSTLSFVREMDLVFSARVDKSLHVIKETQATAPGLEKSDGTLVDYGRSRPQVSLLRIPEVHATGNSGQGVIVGMFDNGVRLLTHESFEWLKILAMHDFVDHKGSVVPLNPDPDFGAHGLATLSVIAGFRQHILIGPAWGATYVLARTENDSSETPLEEDNWVAAIEWADSLGVQVTSTSLGYLTYSWPYTSWTWKDMDGHTTKISRAATMAARKGIVVLTSAGNGGSNSDTTINTLMAPADADSILTVGAVSPYDGYRASCSSVGPTTSVPPRIKPDVMAPGTSIWGASATDQKYLFWLWGGTSFSCPLAAGVVALMLHAVPRATPMQVIEALKMTASQASNPDNLMGWGVIDAVRAIEYLKNLTRYEPAQIPAALSLDPNYPNPFNSSTTINYGLPEAGPVTLTVCDLLGRKVALLVDEWSEPGRYQVVFDASRLSSGVYLYRLQAGRFNQSRKLIVLK